MSIAQPLNIQEPLAPPSKGRRHTMYDKFKQVVGKSQNQTSKRQSIASIFNEDVVNEEPVHSRYIPEVYNQRESSEQNFPFIPERDSQFNSPVSSQKVISVLDSATKNLRILEEERIKKQENKEKLIQLYNQVRSPRPSRRLIENDLTDNIKMRLNIDTEENMNPDYKRMLR